MNERKRRTLDWHLMDIEQRCGFKGGKYTDVNAIFSFIVTSVLASAFYIALCHVPKYVRDLKAIQMILERGWTPYVMMFLFLFSLVALFVKSRKLTLQSRAFKIELIPVGASFALTSESALDVLSKLREEVDDPKRFVLFNRIERALVSLKNVGNVSDVSEMLRAQAENDESQSESSYGLLYGIVWVIPILGFIGTVVGLSGAIGGFGAALSADATVGSLKASLTPVTANLGIAFDTTFVALVFAAIVQMLITLVKRKEDKFLDECRDWAHVNLVSRLRLLEEKKDSERI